MPHNTSNTKTQILELNERNDPNNTTKTNIKPLLKKQAF